MWIFLDWDYWSVSVLPACWPLCITVPITSVLWELAHLNLLCSLSQSGSSWRVKQSRCSIRTLFPDTARQGRMKVMNSDQKKNNNAMYKKVWLYGPMADYRNSFKKCHYLLTVMSLYAVYSVEQQFIVCQAQKWQKAQNTTIQ